jgi:predicted enzyme related to lactoylglutathione lyase
MKSRVKGMWWGTAVESSDPSALAHFYSQLLDWPLVHEEPGTAIISPPETPTFVVFQEVPDYQRPVWPPQNGDQHPMMHFDFQVGDLDAAVADAVSLGASVSIHQPQANVRVLVDPAGHPFCLCLDQE